MTSDTSLVPASRWIRDTRRKAMEWRIEGWKLIEKALLAEVALGNMLGIKCVACHRPFAWNARGKRPYYCHTCRRQKRLEYYRSWRSRNRGHMADYMRRYRKRPLPAEV